MTTIKENTTVTDIEKQTYLERKRQAILSLGYDYVKFRSRTKKSLVQLKSIIQNNACYIERSRIGHGKSKFLPTQEH